MSDLTRFSVSLDKGLLDQFDKQLKKEGYLTRSKAIADLVTQNLVKQEWKSGKEVAGAIIMVYDHHKRNLSGKLTHVQHDYHHLIVSAQHVHLDHHNCLEIIVVKGKPVDVQDLADKLKATKGVKFASLSTASTGKSL